MCVGNCREGTSVPGSQPPGNGGVAVGGGGGAGPRPPGGHRGTPRRGAELHRHLPPHGPVPAGWRRLPLASPPLPGKLCHAREPVWVPSRPGKIVTVPSTGQPVSQGGRLACLCLCVGCGWESRWGGAAGGRQLASFFPKCASPGGCYGQARGRTPLTVGVLWNTHWDQRHWGPKIWLGGQAPGSINQPSEGGVPDIRLQGW